MLTDNESVICTNCRHDLPVTNFHFYNDETVKNVFYGRVIVEQGTALFKFEKKTNVQRLLHGLKYKGYETIGFTLGNWLGGELKTIDSYKKIDVVIPVPLHKKRLRKRGYNQVAKFGAQIATCLDAEFLDDVLIKTANTTSQTKKTRFSRWKSNNELFSLERSSIIENKHILLVDDIITTGATLEACASVLQQAKNVKISIATMAIVV